MLNSHNMLDTLLSVMGIIEYGGSVNMGVWIMEYWGLNAHEVQ